MLFTDIEFSRLKEKMKGQTFRDYADDILNGKKILNRVEYQALVDITHDDRIAWWREARFGMFIHFGLYAQTARGEWAMGRDGMPVQEYERLADSFFPAPDAAEEWAKTAVKAGAKYMVLTTRHHDGFSLWDSKANPYNSARFGCKRDIVREFVDACRKYGLGVGFYSSLMDWHHPDSERAGFDPAARQRFVEYLFELNRELMSNYGKIDILWYDMPYPLESQESWGSLQRNQMIRALQPDILINDRSMLPEDFAVSEEAMSTSGRDVEACLTFNTLTWGYIDPEQAKRFAHTPQTLLKKLSFSCRNCGNLLLNVGPSPDGRIADYEKETLQTIGNWIQENREVVYGTMRPCRGLIGLNCYGEYGSDMLSDVSAKGNTVYVWNYIWPKDGVIYLAGYRNVPKRVYSVKDGTPVRFKHENHRIILYDLPKEPFDRTAGISVIALEFDGKAEYRFCMSCPQVNDGYIEP